MDKRCGLAMPRSPPRIRPDRAIVSVVEASRADARPATTVLFAERLAET
ncbi:hypothetical protein MMB17_16080 [Methylobacterium organophilum]|nr:hypothetical protein [Methylobacterium organophilum]UMY16230.1 hypothetical protein MMB17_16080 [Methylobacterium organophilum]